MSSRRFGHPDLRNPACIVEFNCIFSKNPLLKRTSARGPSIIYWRQLVCPHLVLPNIAFQQPFPQTRSKRKVSWFQRSSNTNAGKNYVGFKILNDCEPSFIHLTESKVRVEFGPNSVDIEATTEFEFYEHFDVSESGIIGIYGRTCDTCPIWHRYSLHRPWGGIVLTMEIGQFSFEL